MTITLISTLHKESGKCNAEQLCIILEKLSPEVVFLEALENTYSKYNQKLFTEFGVYNEKLEIKALQLYSAIKPFEYIPVLDSGMSESFNQKYDRVCKQTPFKKMLDDYDFKARTGGIAFLNSKDSMVLQDEMRNFEYQLLGESDINELTLKDIDQYENNMLRNIYAYCENNPFQTAVFMCGVAHRQSIIQKIASRNELDLSWKIYEA